jgi:mono/diheme cytochrome c family protein
MRASLIAALAAALGLTSGCDLGKLPQDPLMRMYTQRKYRPYSQTDFFADGRSMRPAIEGTVPRERPLAMQYASPVVTRAFIEQGHTKYNIVCATCHGVAGKTEASLVSAKFAQKKPPNLYDIERTDLHIFTVIGNGHGLMPAFPDIPLEERWAVVAYLRVLQASQTGKLDTLPDDIKATLQDNTLVPKEKL